jgi:hypothetical protein
MRQEGHKPCAAATQRLRGGAPTPLRFRPLPFLQSPRYNELLCSYGSAKSSWASPFPCCRGRRNRCFCVEGSRWMPNSRDRKEVEGGQCGSSAQGAKKAGKGQYVPDPQWLSAAQVGGLCPPDDVVREGQATVTTGSVTGDRPDGVNERPGPGPVSTISPGGDHGKRSSQTAGAATPRQDASLAGCRTRHNRAGRACSFLSSLPTSNII